MATDSRPLLPRSANPKSRARRAGSREQSAHTTRDNILLAATEVFARYGYEGGSIEKITQSAKSVDRMIYYYFGSKEGLFIEVLEDMYRRMNDAELALVLDIEQPVASLQGVIDFVVSYYNKNPEFITLLNTAANTFPSPKGPETIHRRPSPSSGICLKVVCGRAFSGLTWWRGTSTC